MLDIWPVLPIVVLCHAIPGVPLRGVLNIVAALKCRDRVCEINLKGIPNSLLKRLAAVKTPFPTLTSIQLSSDDDDWPPAPVLPDSFLGGLAPCLRLLDLHGIPFPAPQKLLLSATDLVTLHLERIPDSGYISPEEMVTCLSTLTKLKQVALGFRSPQSDLHQTSQHTPPLTRTVLPALTSLRFRGDCKYLEALISRIEVPLLEVVDVTFFSQPRFTPPLLSEFILRTNTFDAFHGADIAFYNDIVTITLSQPGGLLNGRTLKLGILSNGPYLQLSFLMELCIWSLPPLPTLEHLHLHGLFSPRHWQYYYPPNTKWQQLLRPFTSVKNLHISEHLALRVADALSTLSEPSISEVLPSLQHIFLPGPQQNRTISAFGAFIVFRGLSGRSVSVHYCQEGDWVVKLLREVDDE
jgi:hypothetical protein